MEYRKFLNKNISLLGFGAMRFPTLEINGERQVDLPLTEKMIDTAISFGVNYFDTAWPYHGGQSERILGRALSKYPRESYYIADKYPGHQVMDEYHPAEIFEEQLRRVGVEYFDFYLLHNVCESSIATYLDERWGIIDYFLEQKRLGRIRHLGFSTHASVETLEEFLSRGGDKMEFCQIQLNYLDYTLQRAADKCELLRKYGIPVWVMEPVRGGRLASLPEAAEARLKEYRPEESSAAWCLRFLQKIPEVTVILSGMSNMEQLLDNLKTFSGGEPLSEEEVALLFEIAEGMKSSVPCTACRYCVDGCPAELDIPTLLGIYNELKFLPTVNAGMRVEFLPECKKPAACIKCGKCTEICPQKINVPEALKRLSVLLCKVPSWRKICADRDAEQKKNS